MPSAARVHEALYWIFTTAGRLWRRCSDVSGAIHAGFKTQQGGRAILHLDGSLFESTSKHELPTSWETDMKNLTTLAAIAACGLGTSVWADTILEPRSVTVHFEDLDINSTPGVATLYKRIGAAAAFVCNDLGTSRSLVYLGRYKTCVHGAVSVAVARINRAAVTEYAAARGVVPPDMPIKGKFARNN